MARDATCVVDGHLFVDVQVPAGHFQLTTEADLYEIDVGVAARRGTGLNDQRARHAFNPQLTRIAGAIDNERIAAGEQLAADRQEQTVDRGGIATRQRRGEAWAVVGHVVGSAGHTLRTPIRRVVPVLRAALRRPKAKLRTNRGNSQQANHGDCHPQ